MAHTVGPQAFQIAEGAGAFYIVAGAAAAAVLSMRSFDVVYAARRREGVVDTFRAGKRGVVFKNRLVLHCGASSIAIHSGRLFAFTADEERDSVTSYQLCGTGKFRVANALQVPTGRAPNGLAVDATGKLLAVTNRGSKDIFLYHVGDHGEVALRSVAPTGNHPSALAFTPDSAFVFVANRDDHTVMTFRVTSRGLVPGNVVAARNHPAGLAVHPSGRFLYVTKLLKDPGDFFPSVSRFRISQRGELQPVTSSREDPNCSGLTGRGALWIGISPSGRTAYVVCGASSEIWSYAIDSPDGALRHCQTTPLMTPKTNAAIGYPY